MPTVRILSLIFKEIEIQWLSVPILILADSKTVFFFCSENSQKDIKATYKGN